MLPPGAVILQVVPALNAGGVERTTLDVARAIVGDEGQRTVRVAVGFHGDRTLELRQVPGKGRAQAPV